MTFSRWFSLIHWWQLHVFSVAASIAHLERRKIEAALPRTPKKDKNIWRKPSSRKLNRNKWQKYRQWRKGYKAWVEWSEELQNQLVVYISCGFSNINTKQCIGWIVCIQIIQPTLINKKREISSCLSKRSSSLSESEAVGQANVANISVELFDIFVKLITPRLNRKEIGAWDKSEVSTLRGLCFYVVCFSQRQHCQLWH